MILNLIFLPLSAVATVLFCLGGSLSPWWSPLLFIGSYASLVVIYFAGLGVASLILACREPKRSSAVCRWLTMHTMHWLMPLMGVFIRLEGAELIPDCPCVLVSNHRSDFDPLTMLAVLRNRKLTYISKAENFKIPIVGPFMRHAGFVGIDRGNGLRAVKSLQTAAELMKRDGLDFGVYPEGTRSKTCKLLRFKTGACYLAQMAEAPIVIMTTEGTERISHRFPLSPVRVSLRVWEVIDRERVMAADQKELTDYIRSVVAAHLPPDPDREEGGTA